MGKKKRAPAPAPAGAPAEPFNNPFAALGAQRASLPEGAAPAAKAELAAPAEGASPFAGKLVLRRERKGHGGKTVTLLQGLQMPAGEARAQLARELGKALGVGARVQESDIVIAGDQQQRLADWLRAHGAKKIVFGC